MTVAFVFTNPRHHLEMMDPVARVLEQRGIECRLISLAELRGWDTPRDDPRVRRVIPFNLRKREGKPSRTDAVLTRKGRIAQLAVWHLAMRPRLRQLLRGARVVVVPNDAVYPYVDLIGDRHGRGNRTVLMQEGIRFPLPTEYIGPVYGRGGTAAVCAWGEGSRDYFVASDVPRGAIEVTGAPRLDGLDPARWKQAGVDLLAEKGVTAAPIAFLSNPIEIQGYGAKQLKLDLFAKFLAEAAPVVKPRAIPIIVKTHLAEDPRDFEQVAQRSPIPELVTVLHTGSIFATLAAARAAVVLTSTVGLEALVFGLPLAVLEIPGHEFAFEYVQQGAATPLRIGQIAAGVEELLADTRRAIGAAFVERHLFDRGHARDHVAAVIERLLG